MATMQKFGSVELNDYLRMTGRRKPKRRMWRLGAVAGCLCFCSFMAGKYTISLESALSMLDRAPREEWQRKLGVVETQRHVERAIAVLVGVAEDPGRPGEVASWALTNIAKQTLEGMRDLGNLESGNASLNRSNINHLKSMLEGFR